MFLLSPLSLLPLTVSLMIELVISQATCYWPNGTVAQGYASCSTTDAAAMCYFTAHTDTCEPNGLVLNINGVYYRNACTDPTWQSPACLLLCPCEYLSISFVFRIPGRHTLINCAGVQTTFAELLHCADDSFCCGFANNTCCALRQGYYLSSTTASILSSAVQSSTPTLAQSSPSPSTTSPTNTNTLSVLGMTSPAATSSSSSQSSNSNALAIGLGVGLGVALLLALSCAAFFFLRARKHRRNESLAGQMPRNTPLNEGVIVIVEKEALDLNTQRPSGSGKLLAHELDTSNPISELS